MFNNLSAMNELELFFFYFSWKVLVCYDLETRHRGGGKIPLVAGKTAFDAQVGRGFEPGFE